MEKAPESEELILPPGGADFIKRHGWAHCDIVPLPTDASTRVYFRLLQTALDRNGSEPATCLLMYDPPPAKSLQQYMHVSALLDQLGLSSPRVFVCDDAYHLALIEDFGDATISRCLHEGYPEEQVYGWCMDALAALHKNAHSLSNEALEVYDFNHAWRELGQFCDWYYPEVMQQPMPEEARKSFEALWHIYWEKGLTALPSTLTCRDFHVDNLILRQQQPPERTCGIIDFQDALWGSPTFDVVSLLQDARRDVDPAVEKMMLDRLFQDVAPSLGWNHDAFMFSYAIMGIQRHSKILGFCVRMARQRNKTKYLPYIPRLWRLIARNLLHPGVEDLKAWYDQWMPHDHRIQPVILDLSSD